MGSRLWGKAGETEEFRMWRAGKERIGLLVYAETGRQGSRISNRLAGCETEERMSVVVWLYKD